MTVRPWPGHPVHRDDVCSILHGIFLKTEKKRYTAGTPWPCWYPTPPPSYLWEPIMIGRVWNMGGGGEQGGAPPPPWTRLVYALRQGVGSHEGAPVCKVNTPLVLGLVTPSLHVTRFTFKLEPVIQTGLRDIVIKSPRGDLRFWISFGSFGQILDLLKKLWTF